MKIALKEITVADLVDGYADKADEGVVGYGGRLDIRPPYQREFIYKDAQRDAVIDTLRKDFPLNVMYWAVRSDGNFEVIDGQQRTISICQYVQNGFSFKELYFQNLRDDQRRQVLDYKLTVYLCTGSDSEKLEWFKTINIAGAELTDQELRNAVYSGAWVEKFDAEKLETEIARLMQDDDIKKKSGIYAYLLIGGEHHLNIRAFTPAQKRSAFERQQGTCPECGKEFGIDEMEGDHITPWREGGKTEPDNCQMLCKECNRRKGRR